MGNQLLERIEQRLKETGLSASAASIKAGLSKDAIRNMQRGRAVSMRAESVRKLASVLETTPQWLLGETDAEASLPVAELREDPSFPFGATHDLPVYGLAAGSILGQLHMTNEPVEFIPCPPGLAKVREAYALIVTGSSMEPRYTAGDMVFVHPHRPPRQGDHIIIQEAQNGGTATWIKRFEKWTETHLVTTQYNPLSEVKFKREQIIAIHRVLTTNELFGV